MANKIPDTTDITQWLFTKATKIPIDKVIKSPHFNLFHGTNALEIGNSKLDTGLIALSPEELDFDCSKVRSLSEVLWISDSILRSVFTWLDNSALSVSVFSNRYVEELLLNYINHGDKQLKDCVFYHGTNVSKDMLLVDQVLRSVVLGALSFVNLGVTLAQGGTVYEEEDINSSTMSLDLLSTIDSSVIANEIETSIEYLKKNYSYHENSDILIKILTILLNFLDIPYFCGVNIEEGDKPLPFDIEILHSLLRVCLSLREKVEYLNKLPEIPGCYSMGIQKRLDNRAPTRNLTSYKKKEDYSSLILFVEDLIGMFDIQHRTCPQDVINYGKNFSNYHHHVLSRAIFSIFLVRDDGSILGNENIKTFIVREMMGFNCYGCSLFDSKNSIVRNKVDDFINRLALQYLEYFQSFNQNPCRQRQHLMKIVLGFDSLQVASESLELELSETFSLKDDLKENGQFIPALPLTSWVYLKKLSIMVDIIFRGFELELYNIWEYLEMYWTVLNILSHQIIILERIQKHVITKIQNFKSYQQHHLNLKSCLQQVTQELTYTKTLNSLTLLQLLNLQQLTNAEIIKTPSFPFSTEERLFEIRQKPFKSIGVPQQSKFKDYQNFVKSPVLTSDEFKTQVDQLKKSINDNINFLLKSPCYNNGINIKQWQNWLNLYKRSMVGISLNLYNKKGITIRIEVVRDGFHRYFPVIKCFKKI